MAFQIAEACVGMRFKKTERGRKVAPLTRLWILRLLMRMGCHAAFVRSGDFLNDDIAVELGFEELMGPEAGDFHRKDVLKDLQTEHALWEAKSGRVRPPVMLSRNIQRLAKMLGFTPADCRVLEFAVLVNTDELLDEACDWLGHSVTTNTVIRAMSKILDMPVRDVADALSHKGLLARSGILSTSRSIGNSLRGRLDLLSEAFADRMVSADTDPVDLLRGTVAKSPAAELEWSDYGHLQASLKLLRPYLQYAVQTKRRGVNIILHGPPGTGKTQLARLLASELRSGLFEVSSEDGAGDSVMGDRRLRALSAAQNLLAKQHAMILFDEVEDVFGDGDDFMGRRSTAQVRKAWMNRMLEDAPVPTLWLSNSIDRIDPAFIRRFDMVIEVPIPPRSQRKRIIERTCGHLVSEACVARIAESDKLAPAVVSRAASVVRALGATLDTEGVERALEQLIGNTLEAQGHARLVRHDPSRLPSGYDPGFLNPDTDIQAIARGLHEARTGRLCLYGPPGTGKTAFSRWLARELDVPLAVKRASDIISPWVGGTERNLAKVFREAEQEGALLMIDEVDGFLQERKCAQHSWEVTAVNEMLTQMEAFPGIFIASTNLMDRLDQAALRRFDAKIRLDYLAPAQAIAMLRACCQDLGLDAPTPEEDATVGRFGNLAPGDFAALVRQNRFRTVGSASQLVGLLKAEVALKGGNRRSIGFVQ
jgi:transitional endoplasmic reticulum ATPase